MATLINYFHIPGRDPPGRTFNPKALSTIKATRWRSGALCQSCRRLGDIDKLLRTLRETGGRADLLEPGDKHSRIPHHLNRAAFEKSVAQGCSLRDFALAQTLMIRGGISGTINNVYKNGRRVVYTDSDIFVRLEGSWGLYFRHIEQRERSRYVAPLFATFKLDVDATNPIVSLWPRKRPSSSSKSQQTFDHVSFWIKNCHSNHEQCSTPPSEMPTRVIDVTREGQEPRRHLTNSRKGEWVTLSHCWGKERFLATLTTNIDRHRERILLSDLPPNFQDAIMITRNLGYQYLWIDSLCIIQDSPEDWRAESVKMGSTYKNCALNISADAASGAFGGMFRACDRDGITKDAALRLPCRSSRHGVSGNSYVNQRPRRYEGESTEEMLLGKNIIQTRAWVFQESRLSPRRVRYAARQIAWSCRSVDLTEEEPFESPERSSCWQDSAIDNKFSFFSMGPTTLEPHLDLPKDRIPAFDGLAREFSERTGYHYYSGIFREDCHRGLLWMSQSGKRTTEGNSPSWSWASSIPEPNFRERKRGISYDIRNLGGHNPTQPSELIEISQLDLKQLDLTEEGLTQILQQSDYQAKKWALNMRGPVIWVDELESMLPEPPSGPDSWAGWEAGTSYLPPIIEPVLHWTTEPYDPTNQRKREGMTIYPDEWIDDRTYSSSYLRVLLLLQISSFCYRRDPDPDDDPPEYTTWCLLLEPLYVTTSGQEIYQRVGLVEIRQRDFGLQHVWNGEERLRWRRKTVTII